MLRPRPARAVGFDSRLRQRIECRFADTEPKERIDFRVDQYLHAREIIVKEAQELADGLLQNVMSEVETYIVDSEPSEELPVSFLVNANNKVVYDRLKARPDWSTVVIHSKECPNLKSALKLVVNRFTNREQLDDVHVDRRLTYDFGILVDWLDQENKDRLIVCIEDTECFDVSILDGLLHYMTIYLPGVPFHLVLSLTTSPHLVLEAVSQTTLSSIQGRTFSQTAATPEYLTGVRKKLGTIGCQLGDELFCELEPLRLDRAVEALKYAVLAKFCGSTNPSNINDVELHRTVFAPTYRPALETALAVPDYFGGQREAIPLVVLYQIYRESSMYINIYDFYTEFRARIEKPATHDPALWEKQALAWFLEGIAELKLMGVLRDCKRKFECVEKVSWMGV